jgi:hypothetical protein
MVAPERGWGFAALAPAPSVCELLLADFAFPLDRQDQLVAIHAIAILDVEVGGKEAQIIDGLAFQVAPFRRWPACGISLASTLTLSPVLAWHEPPPDPSEMADPLAPKRARIVAMIGRVGFGTCDYGRQQRRLWLSAVRRRW